MIAVTVTPENLTYIAAAVLAILFDYLPGLSPWYNTLENIPKRLFMAALLFAILITIFAGICGNLFDAGTLTCSRESAVALINVFIMAIAVNQSVHLLSKPGKSNPHTLPEPNSKG